jgi:hypothetical protein
LYFTLDTATTSSDEKTEIAKEIVGNLPKVWKVLTELLSHQIGPPLVISEISEKSTHNCYKSVDTPVGPRLVPSVSKTYIRLKVLNFNVLFSNEFWLFVLYLLKLADCHETTISLLSVLGFDLGKKILTKRIKPSEAVEYPFRKQIY